MKIKKAALVLGLCLIVTACAKQSFITSNDRANSYNLSESSHFFVQGIGQSDTKRANNICNGKLTKVEYKKSFVDVLLAGLSTGIYTPKTVSLSCNEAGRS